MIKLSKYIGIPNSTLIERLKRQNLMPNDVEKIADYFQKPIGYYFDREEQGQMEYTVKSKMTVANDSVVKIYSCTDCISKQKEIDRLTSQLNDKEKIISLLEGRNRPAVSE